MNPCRARFLEEPHAPLTECILEISQSGIKAKAANGRLFWVSWEECRSAEKAGRIWRISGVRENVPFVFLIDEEASFQEAISIWSQVLPGKGPKNSQTLDRLFLGKLMLLGVGIIAFIIALYFAFVNLYWIVPIGFDEKMGEILHSASYAKKGGCRDASLDSFVIKAQKVLRLPTDRFLHPVHILPDSTVNAFAIPGGRIYLYRGIINHSESPDEILGVIAHEMSHSELRHSTRQIWQGMTLSLLFSMTIDPGAILDIANQLVSLQYSRSFEREADLQASQRMSNAYLDPTQLMNLLRRITPSQPQKEITFLSTHPIGEERFQVFQGAEGSAGNATDSVFRFERIAWKKLRELECK